MAAPVVLGTTGLQPCENHIIAEFTESGSTRTVRYKAPLSERATIESTLKGRLGETYSGDFSLRLRRIATREERGMLYCDLTYSPADSGGFGPPPINETRIRVTTTGASIPIEQHPDYDKAFVGEGGAWEGIDSYLAPQITVTEESTVARLSFALSEINILSTVGTLTGPPSISGKTANAWLHAGRDISIEPDRVVTSNSYQHAAALWKTDIYDP